MAWRWRRELSTGAEVGGKERKRERWRTVSQSKEEARGVGELSLWAKRKREPRKAGGNSSSGGWSLVEVLAWRRWGELSPGADEGGKERKRERGRTVSDSEANKKRKLREKCLRG